MNRIRSAVFQSPKQEHYKRLSRLARLDPVVYAGIQIMFRSGMTWEDALVEIVCAMAERQNKTNEVLSEYVANYPVPPTKFKD